MLLSKVDCQLSVVRGQLPVETYLFGTYRQPTTGYGQQTTDNARLSFMPEYKVERENVTFWLRVKPRAARERLSVDASGELRLELHAPPTEGLANEACTRFFARALRLPQACIVILSGRKARRKLLRITGHSVEETIAQIKTLAAASDRRTG
jgi:hypothetical protein